MARKVRYIIRHLLRESRYFSTGELINNLQEEIGRLGDGEGHFLYKCENTLPLGPRCDLDIESYETEESHVVLLYYLPGYIRKEDIEVEAGEDVLNIVLKVNKKKVADINISMDTKINREKVKARYEKGVLIIEGPKIKKEKKKIAVE